MKAQASRGGADWQASWWRVDVNGTPSRIPLIVPLFITALRRSEELILAMEARGYVSGAQRTRFARFAWTKADTLAILGMLGIYLLAWRMQWPALTYFL